ncbi:MAG: hypothetical protein ACE5HW_07670 [Candidatus Methanofastidiosia archaeon]
MKTNAPKSTTLIVAIVLWLLGAVGIFTTISVPYPAILLALGGLVAIAGGHIKGL